jgi:hypothetical protein
MKRRSYHDAVCLLQFLINLDYIVIYLALAGVIAVVTVLAGAYVQVADINGLYFGAFILGPFEYLGQQMVCIAAQAGTAGDTEYLH